MWFTREYIVDLNQRESESSQGIAKATSIQSESNQSEKREMAELQHLSHEHPLLFNEGTSIQRHNTDNCAGCEEKVSAPSFSCGDCGFHLHKKCAEAPLEIHHPFHRSHPLVLLPLQNREEVCCGLCDANRKGFIYHCPSCEVYLDINCALLPRDSALISANNQVRDFDCSSCSSSPVGNTSYACFDCRTFFHKSLELPLQIDHPYHRKHQLVLEYDVHEWRDCHLCSEKHRGLFYRCSLCNVDIHINCAWPPTIIEDKSHPEHPFSLLLRPHSFNCDACGIQGNNVSYICSTCDIQVHKNCISLPRFIRINLHNHPISHSFYCCINGHDSRTWDCRLCYKKVNTEHGSYYCSQPDCDFAIHVKCSIKNKILYDIMEVVSLDVIDELDLSSYNPIIRVIEETKIGDDVIYTKIIHFSHEQHVLIFSDEAVDNKHLCDGCVKPIFSSFYYCSQCDFLLHKACAELWRKARLWFDSTPFILSPNGIFKCDFCRYQCSGFSYKLDSDNDYVLCLQCAALPHFFPYQADEPHHIFFNDNPGQCHSCGRRDLDRSCKCKKCDFVLDVRCVILPRTASNKCDRHSLTLAYKEHSDYSLRHYCDICEERRNPKCWFYHCEVCDKAIHPKCALGKYPFIKRGSKYRHLNHPHTLTFVQKMYYYPKCTDCGDPCEDLALECLEHGCNYVVHWKCIEPSYFADTDNDSGSDGGNDSNGE
ncbi:hypothetical protein GQ457_04G024520 [Hibiscus cannabinus]